MPGLADPPAAPVGPTRRAPDAAPVSEGAREHAPAEPAPARPCPARAVRGAAGGGDRRRDLRRARRAPGLRPAGRHRRRPRPSRREPDSAGVVIQVARYEDPGDDPDLPNWFETETASDGSFRLDGLPPGRYGLAADPPGRELGLKRIDFVLPGDRGHGPIELVWPAGGSILVDLGKPKKGVTVRLDRQFHGGTLSGFRHAKTDAGGKVAFDHLEPGDYSVDWGGRSLPATVAAGKQTRVVFQGSCTFRGTLAGPDGRPLAEAIVRLGIVWRKGQRYRSIQCTSRADGGFGIDSAAPGEYRVTVQVVGRRGFAVSAGRVTLAEGETVVRDLRVPDTRIAGRITRAGTGDPVLPHEVQVTADAVEGDADATAFCDEHGRYVFVGLPPGRYRIWIAPLRISVREVRREVVLPASGRLEGVDFELAPR